MNIGILMLVVFMALDYFFESHGSCRLSTTRTKIQFYAIIGLLVYISVTMMGAE